MRPVQPGDEDKPQQERTFFPCQERANLTLKAHRRCLRSYVSTAGAVHICDCECHL